MNDEFLEHHLRALPSPELPDSWRAEILARALHEARRPVSPRREFWPPVLLFLRNVMARNPFTAGALTALWIVILLLKTTTPVDPAERNLLAQAHVDQNRPVYLVSLQEEMALAALAPEQMEQDQARPIP